MNLPVKVIANKMPPDVACEVIATELSKVAAYVEKQQDGSTYYHFGLAAPNIRYSRFSAFSGINMSVEGNGEIVLKMYCGPLILAGLGFALLIAMWGFLQPPFNASTMVFPVIFPILFVGFALFIGYARVRHWLNGTIC